MSTVTTVEIEPWKVSGEQLFRTHARYPNRIGDPADFPAIGDWLDGIGVPSEGVFALAVYRTAEGRHLLAVAEACRDDNGVRYLNFATGEPAERYRVFDIGTEPSWPDLLNHEPYAPPRSTFA